MQKTSLYEKIFMNIINEDSIDKKNKKKVKEEDENTVGGGALGPAAAVGHNALKNTDFYATGDFRKPKALGAIQTRKGTIGKKRRKNKKRN
tara:strand:+ start:3451 stop:3723 length:273 start_codon:yes stop_codon:yes gene_type:complete